MKNDGEKKHILRKVLIWFLGLYLILVGILGINKISIGVSLFAIMFGIIIIPPVDRIIKDKINQNLQGKININKYKVLKIFIGIIIFSILAISLPKSSDNTNIIKNNVGNTTKSNSSIEKVEYANDSSIKEEESKEINKPQINIQENITLSEKNGKYIGNTINQIKNDSNGKFEFQNGCIYEGSFINNQIEGQGKLTIPNIGIYEGDFSNGKRNGYGKMNFSNGDVYEGSWNSDEMSGEGTYIFANGDKYVGEFLKNMFNGKGTYTFKNTGKEYKGTWSNNSYKE